MISSHSGKYGNCIDVKENSNTTLRVSETDPMLNDADQKGFFTTRASFAAFVQGVKDGEFDQFCE